MSERDATPDEERAGEALPEGEEDAPPGVRAAAAVRWALVGLMAIAALGAWASWAGIGARLSRPAAAYMCPMHPSVVQDRKGDCPICGMDLVLVDASRQAASAPPPAAAAAASKKFWCPMHPEIESDDPEARCPRCGGMKLVLRPGPAGKPGGAPPGLVPLEIGAERTQLMGMRTAKVTRQRLAPQLRTVGFVSANESHLAIVAARFTGWVESLEVTQTGQKVEKGQVLATVYSPELLTAQQVYINAAKWADKQGATGGAAIGGSLDADARKRLELLGIAREDIVRVGQAGQPQLALPLRAPVAGYVARKAALPGLYLQPGTELFQIADLSSVWVVADVYERDMSRVRVGQGAQLLLSAYPGESFAGRVQFIYPAVNPESRTLQARMEFRNPGLRLKPGMFGDVVIALDATDGLAVPSDAVVDTGEVQYVFVSRPGGRFEPRVVRLGARGDGKVQVLEGLAEGDAVVTSANFLVDSESRLRAAVEGFAPAAAAAAREERREHDGGHRDEDRRL
ncbi:MAG TPA: efflux RND transporter periplasmic adaptor subunit [Anaeromyxobacteraceae bacterium]|nr:efflux RND transporter periplasmic adaptor subunit [Anaeromyxobacteraceae bacterium]